MSVYRLVRANTKAAAVISARGLCQCVRKSFAGVKWVDPITKETVLIPWSEIDA